jgi:three-Cys-motif partner protein
MCAYLQPQDDGLPCRPSGPWVAEKLDYLGRYINAFETAMQGKPWRSRHYIDLFAGPGKCIVRGTRTIYLGSPLLSLTTEYPFTGYFFVELDTEYIAALQQRCNASPLRDQIQCLPGDSNVVVKEIVEHIQNLDRLYIPGKWSSLNLAFLDPDGLDLQWETVATLAQLNRMDLIIHYSQYGLNLNMAKAYRAEEQTAVDRFFGGMEWRQIYEKHESKQTHVGIHRLLMDHYKEKLQGLGYTEVLRDDEICDDPDEPLICNSKREAPLYRLLFASKHPLGHHFWRAVTRRNVYGQARLL